MLEMGLKNLNSIQNRFKTHQMSNNGKNIGINYILFSTANNKNVTLNEKTTEKIFGEEVIVLKFIAFLQKINNKVTCVCMCVQANVLK